MLGFEAPNNLAGSVGLSPGGVENLSFFQRSKNCVSGLNSHYSANSVSDTFTPT
ncbi:hypothetical protein RBSH_04628 [Rhodopirellula baltica SH28]|uniref:Uncharacterized protein n=1 Tax=Rhodopirellula baltica SH28 TaxID=993517 RepID=K5E2U3_RHOBT|nr:hypothetical protein RBSH_04628 [Rhodopirellula baltica SH28]